MFCLVGALYPAKNHIDRTSSLYNLSTYLYYTMVLNLTYIMFPMMLNQIRKFENLNDISINIYLIEE